VRTRRCKLLKKSHVITPSYTPFRMASQKSSYKSSYNLFWRALICQTHKHRADGAPAALLGTLIRHARPERVFGSAPGIADGGPRGQGLTQWTLALQLRFTPGYPCNLHYEGF
jgi:hypothetical protein